MLNFFVTKTRVDLTKMVKLRLRTVHKLSLDKRFSSLVSSGLALKGIFLIQLALWFAPYISHQRSASSTGVSATVDLYTSEVAASETGAINSLAFPSVLGGSVVFDTLYSTYNVTGIMAIGAALLAAGGMRYISIKINSTIKNKTIKMLC